MTANDKILPTLVITGPVGAGKTTVGYAIADLLDAAGKSHAAIDMDTLRWAMTGKDAPPDPFNAALGLRNLAAIIPNYRAVGVERFILMDVVETETGKFSYQQAIPQLSVQVVRLRASLETCHTRLEQRETGTSLEWHKNRAAELIAIMEARQLQDILIETDNRTVESIAQEILTRAGW